MTNRRETLYRRSIRLPDHDYSQPGAYFVTIVAYKHICIFGEAAHECIQLSEIGRVVESTWCEIPMHFQNVSNEHFLIMPNHLHGIIIIENPPDRARHAAPLPQFNISSQKSNPSTLGTIVGSFKSAVTKTIHQINGLEDIKVWQRNFDEHIIRDEQEYRSIVNYIMTNPMNWENDPEYVI